MMRVRFMLILYSILTPDATANRSHADPGVRPDLHVTAKAFPDRIDIPALLADDRGEVRGIHHEGDCFFLIVRGEKQLFDTL